MCARVCDLLCAAAWECMLNCCASTCVETIVYLCVYVCVNTDTRIHIAHGSDIATMPPGSYVHRTPLNAMSSRTQDGQYAYLGVKPGVGASGSVVVFSDSNCLDSSHQVMACYDLMSRILDRVIKVRAEGHIHTHTHIRQRYALVRMCPGVLA